MEIGSYQIVSWFPYEWRGFGLIYLEPEQEYVWICFIGFWDVRKWASKRPPMRRIEMVEFTKEEKKRLLNIFNYFKLGADMRPYEDLPGELHDETEKLDRTILAKLKAWGEESISYPTEPGEGECTCTDGVEDYLCPIHGWGNSS